MAQDTITSSSKVAEVRRETARRTNNQLWDAYNDPRRWLEFLEARGAYSSTQVTSFNLSQKEKGDLEKNFQQWLATRDPICWWTGDWALYSYDIVKWHVRQWIKARKAEIRAEASKVQTTNAPSEELKAYGAEEATVESTRAGPYYGPTRDRWD